MEIKIKKIILYILVISFLFNCGKNKQQKSSQEEDTSSTTQQEVSSKKNKWTAKEINDFLRLCKKDTWYDTEECKCRLDLFQEMPYDEYWDPSNENMEIKKDNLEDRFDKDCYGINLD